MRECEHGNPTTPRIIGESKGSGRTAAPDLVTVARGVRGSPATNGSVGFGRGVGVCMRNALPANAMRWASWISRSRDDYPASRFDGLLPWNWKDRPAKVAA